MQPSEGIPGVILNGRECRRARAALKAYPTSISEGSDPDVAYALKRMEMIEDKIGLDTFVLPASTARKLGEFINEQVNARSPYRVTSLMQVAPAILGMCIFESYRDARQRLFGKHLVEMSMRSSRIAREQIIPKR